MATAAMHATLQNSNSKSLLLPMANSTYNTNDETIYHTSDGVAKTNYTVADVYDDAAVIGSELAKIISNYGSDVIKDLMPKWISVLEVLEKLTIKNEKENEEIIELKMRVHSLEYEKAQKNNERVKFEKEVEEIEENWQKESFKLINMVNKLREDNKRLSDSLDQNNSILKSNDHLVIKQEELNYMKQIKEENIKLKEVNRFKDREIEQRQGEVDALSSQIESLTNTMLNYRRKQIVAQNQIEKLVKAKAELECRVTERDQQLNAMRKKLHNRSIQNDDQSNYLTLENEEVTKSRTTSEISTNSAQSLKTEVSETISINPKDPDRPRFTLKELQKVLMEKNQLTVELDETRDELVHLKRGEVYAGEVQGPINREPEEKMDPESKKGSSSPTGIRRFFSFFLSNSDGAFGYDNQTPAVPDRTSADKII